MTGTCHIAVAMKPLTGGFTQNALKHGVAGLNLDECRVQTTGRPARTNERSASGLTGTGGASTYGSYAVRGSVSCGTTSQGRWPSNVILGHNSGCHVSGTEKVRSPIRRPTGKPIYNTEGKPVGWNDNKVMDTTVRTHADADGMETVDVWECDTDCTVRKMGEQSGEAMGFSGGGIRKVKSDIMPSIQVGKEDAKPNYYGDMGTAARYFKQVSEFVEPSERRTI